MLKVFKSDLYRFVKNKLFYAIIIFVTVLAITFITLIRQEIKIGISVFGDLTAFKDFGDVIKIGILWNKGLGLLLAILISVFVGQEYRWQTWQNKWNIVKNRVPIYASKALLSAVTGALIFLLFEIIALLFSGHISDIITKNYVLTIISGVFIYMALGTVMCSLSILIKNSICSIIVCICYVMLGETIVSLITNLCGFSIAVNNVAEWMLERTLYCMSLSIATQNGNTFFVVFNSIVIMIISTILGLLFFRKYEI